MTALAEAAARLAASAEKQGFRAVTRDPSVIAKIAAVLVDRDDERRVMQKAGKKKTAGAITSPAVPEVGRVSGAT